MEKVVTEELIVPVVALRGLVVMPNMLLRFDLNRKKSIAAIEYAMNHDKKVFLVSQLDPETEDPTIDEVYKTGCLAVVKQINKHKDGVVGVFVSGISRGRIENFLTGDENDLFETGAYLSAEVELLSTLNDIDSPEKAEGMMDYIGDLFQKYIQFFPKIGQGFGNPFTRKANLEVMIDQIAAGIPIDYKKKQQILETLVLSERIENLAVILSNEINMANVKMELANKIKGRIEQHQKEYILREQMGYIQEELGDKESFSDAARYEEELEKLDAEPYVKEKITTEISRLKSLSDSSSEGAVERGYIETLLKMPWNKASIDNVNLSHAEKVLNEEHYGLEKVKERILEFLAVRTLTGKGKSPIICLVGPPGTGKTSVARSVAAALNKEYVRICLGGVRDEAEIRGHRKTYVGAMPGRIANGLKQAGVNNPLMLLDEIDKVSNDYKGDTFSALLEVLDAEQNSHFIDHYVEIPVDLSEILFICTANSVAEMPRPLVDRMEIIEVNSYTANEKFHIAKEHLLKKQLEKNGLTSKNLKLNDGAIKAIIEFYTREAGVRELERKIGELCRKSAKQILSARQNGEKELTIKVNAKNLSEFLGKEKYSREKANTKDQVGIVRGLAWTSVGGDTLEVEVNVMPGKGDIDLTGQLGDIMKESAITALSYVRSVADDYKVAPDFFKEHDFHIHVPEGAVPKDGPSAGITMATAILSAVVGKKVYASIAMTGEVTLRGRVLPIGGLKEKLLAAKNAGIKKVLVPSENQKDIEEISEEIKDGLEIVFVSTMDQVAAQALK